jgi:hypothetical protein
MKVVPVLFAVVLLGGLSGCATVSPSQIDAKTADSGYFLSMKQKGQLIGTGRIQDAQGVWYDVWIVPGYVQPARRTRTHLQRTGADFAEYVQPRKYHDLAEASGDAFEWAYDDCLTDFTVKGVPRAWGRYWSSANRRTSQRVFGWWLAYPWAFLESTVDTLVRVPVGLAGTTLGTAWGVAVVPGYHAINSAAVGTWHFTVDAVLLPTIACTWNTIIAPPLALVGQKPAPSRADGFWLEQLSAEDVLATSALDTPVRPKDVEALAAWGRLLLTASQPCEDQRQALRKQTQAEHESINLKSQQVEADIRSQERDAIRAAVSDPSQRETLDYLQSRAFDSRRTSRASGDVRRHLANREELSPADVNRMMNLLIHNPPSTATNQPPLRPKTNPVEHSIEVMTDVQ